MLFTDTSASTLEDKPERELYLTTRSTCPCNLSSIRIHRNWIFTCEHRQVPDIRNREVRVIEGVEDLCPELN